MAYLEGCVQAKGTIKFIQRHGPSRRHVCDESCGWRMRHGGVLVRPWFSIYYKDLASAKVPDRKFLSTKAKSEGRQSFLKKKTPQEEVSSRSFLEERQGWPRP